MFWKKQAELSDDPTLRAAVDAVSHPRLEGSLGELGMVKLAARDGGKARVAIELSTPASPWKSDIGDEVAAAVHAVDPQLGVEVQWSAAVTDTRYGGGGKGSEPPSMSAIGNLVLVASGKGGVGKSTAATNLACALGRTGARVGLLDADIYGPSIPTMLGEHGDVTSADGKTIDPLDRFGIKLMSMGFFLPAEKAMIWRGPMVHGAVLQFLRDVNWGELDYLVVDLPPGTGDVQLTFAQEVRVTGAVVVSTPQEVALADVIRAKTMFDTVNIPILGLVENMAYFVCPDCDAKHHLFSHAGARNAAASMGLDFLGELPLVQAVREGGDRGIPVVQAEPDSAIAQAFMDLARQVAGRCVLAGLEGKAAAEAAAAAAPGPSPAGKRRLPIVG